jgi:hypothetical protein
MLVVRPEGSATISMVRLEKTLQRALSRVRLRKPITARFLRCMTRMQQTRCERLYAEFSKAATVKKSQKNSA